MKIKKQMKELFKPTFDQKYEILLGLKLILFSLVAFHYNMESPIFIVWLIGCFISLRLYVYQKKFTLSNKSKQEGL